MSELERELYRVMEEYGVSGIILPEDNDQKSIAIPLIITAIMEGRYGKSKGS